MYDRQNFPLLPTPARFLMAPLPLYPLSLILQRVVENVARRHPGLLSRLDSHAAKVFIIDPTDMPLVFRLVPRPERPEIEARRRGGEGAFDARIAGPFSALLAMIHGVVDGDALFFSRDIRIEGDTEAVLALRNALDDAELNLRDEAAAIFGPGSEIAGRMARLVEPRLSRLTGLALARADRRDA